MAKQSAAVLTTSIDTIVVIPALNEALHIGKTIESLKDGDDRRYEIWVADGGSSDGTQDIVSRIAAHDENVRLLHNPERTQASALNLAAGVARERKSVRYLVRADAHAGYPPNWVRRLIRTAEEERADSVVVPMRTCGGSPMLDASADLFNSWLGNGGSPHRTGNKRGFVEHGHHALFRLDAFFEAGGYDPSFLANEDAELDVRLTRIGKRIFLENEAAIDYVPRASFAGVWRQFFRNGRFRLRTSFKHGRPLQPRQLAPAALAAGLSGSLILGALVHPVFLLPACLYCGALLAASAMIATRKTPRRIALIAATAATSHVAFGFGAIFGLVREAARRGSAPPKPPVPEAEQFNSWRFFRPANNERRS